ncbi:threonine-phosphate decarboxylase CobD [Paracoccus sp. (in: a-proteobacteria)]|uniref:threonine-phosphate decarboxylase CobD n=1 Tax=Paracoccus sp. TaxID=267 RepID=UPI0026E0A4DC|nr:threonine-phosphate decarboxylase CobD [Paracoccus sp. (in: a-proteobacteria)]MDO5646892.1 threonine-phosphate decarboxylase CobD [Paracoccus sp. (in: a-proteobacteria)]
MGITSQRDHGGDIDRAIEQFGDTCWIDLSTGINRASWPIRDFPPSVWRRLPTATALAGLNAVAAAWFRCDPAQVLAVAGASAAIQLLPRILPAGRAAVLTPSYNEHAASLRAAGWDVTPAADLDAMRGADLAVVVNPNNPDGREWSPDRLAGLAAQVGHLIVDESFADPRPDLSLIPTLPDNATVLRSFGKFWGLAGVRLGWAVGAPDLLARMDDMAGPWAVSGPAIALGTAAMADLDWCDQTVLYHSEASLLLDRLATARGWQVVGGTHLFRLYDTPNATTAQEMLAASQIWTRRFPYSDHWLRMGVPSPDEWDRVIAAMTA